MKTLWKYWLLRNKWRGEVIKQLDSKRVVIEENGWGKEQVVETGVDLKSRMENEKKKMNAEQELMKKSCTMANN